MNIARRYARGLFALGGHERAEILLKIGEAFAQPAVAAVWASPTFPRKQKKQLVVSLLAAIASDDAYLKRLLMLLLEERREKYLPEIAHIYTNMVKEQEGIVTVEVQSARPLAENERQEIVQTMSEKLRKQLQMRFTIKPELLGGLLVSWNFRVLDFSLKNELRAIVHYANEGGKIATDIG